MIEQSSFYRNFINNIKKQKSFTITGLTSFSRLLMLKYIKELSNKKILFIVSTEQNGLKYSSDLEKLWGLSSALLPYQNTSVYETLPANLYDYQKQLKILQNKPEIVICPIKTLTEKFPTESFLEENKLSIKIGDNITQQDLLKKLLSLGYRRSTMVSDMGEFSIRGDISDIFSLDDYPLRIEFWGDEVVDIRYFNNETQKSIEKIQEAEIFPLYKFVLPNDPPDGFSANLKIQFQEERYFEGINVYQSFFNMNLVSVLEYFKDYIIIYDEFAEISAKLSQISENLNTSYQDALKNNLIEPLKDCNHFSEKEVIVKTAGFQKISFNNFLADENNEIIDIDSKNIPIFDANMDKVAEYLLEKKIIR